MALIDPTLNLKLDFSSDLYRAILHDAFHAAGLHECVGCGADLDQGGGYVGYPTSNCYGPGDVGPGFVCRRCAEALIAEPVVEDVMKVIDAHFSRTDIKDLLKVLDKCPGRLKERLEGRLM